MSLKKMIIILLMLILSVSAVSYFVRIDTGKYCGESPVVRWKFAIYIGECDAETGCHFIKMKDTGVLEYLGFKEITCYGEPLWDPDKQPSKIIDERDTLATKPEITKAEPLYLKSPK